MFVCVLYNNEESTTNSSHSHAGSNPTTPQESLLFEPLSPFPMANPVITWGEYGSERFTDILNAVYAEAMHWKMNFFKVPYGNVGKSFLS